MKEVETSNGYKIENKIEISAITSKDRTIANNIDILAILEWLESFNDNKNLLETLRALAVVIKTTDGLEDTIKDKLNSVPISFNENMLIKKETIDEEYFKIINSIIEETELTKKFCQKANIDIENYEIEKNGRIVFDDEVEKEQQSNQSDYDHIKDIEEHNKRLEKIVEDNSSEDIIREEAKEIFKSPFLETFIKAYNSYKKKRKIDV